MTSRRGCRRVVSPDGLRPSDVLAAFFALGVAFLVAGAVAGALYGVAGWAPGRWLALHLAFVGGVSQLVVGASQFFTGAFLATTPPPRGLVRAQLATWNAGALLVAVGVSAHVTALADAGAALLVAGLALLAAGLRSMQRRSLQRAAWAVRWYYACAGFLALGVVAGAVLVHGLAWRAGDLLGAHLALNLAGWFGTAIVGTLHTFYPSLTQTRLAFPRLQGPAFWAWVGGAATLALGYAVDTGALMLAGWGGLLAAGALLAANIVRSTRLATEPLSLPARLIGVAQCFLVAGLVVGLATAIAQGAPVPAAGPERAALAVLLLAGWIGLTVVASLLHLLAVLARVRDLARPLAAGRPLQDRIVPVAAAAGVAALATARLAGIDQLATPAALVLACVYLVLGTRVLALAARAIRPRPLAV